MSIFYILGQIQDVLSSKEVDVCGNLTKFSWLSDGNEVMMSYSQDADNPTAVEILLEYETIKPPARQNTGIPTIILKIFMYMYPFTV